MSKSAATSGQTVCKELHSQSIRPTQQGHPVSFLPVRVFGRACQLCILPFRHSWQCHQMNLLLCKVMLVHSPLLQIVQACAPVLGHLIDLLGEDCNSCRHLHNSRTLICLLVRYQCLSCTFPQCHLQQPLPTFSIGAMHWLTRCRHGAAAIQAIGMLFFQ